MMTASSVEFFPCRVQLMGLPRTGATTTATSLVNHDVTSSSQSATRRSLLAKVQGVSRNLFGAPDPIEIDNIYQQEAKRQYSYFLQRYNIDIRTSKPTDKQKTQHPTDSMNIDRTTRQPTHLPTLIEHEFKQHEQRLQKEKCNLSRYSSETTSPNNRILIDTSSGSKVMRGICECSSPTLSFGAERPKPYTRQSFLKDSFSIRKNKISLTSHCKQANAERSTLEGRLNSHRNLKVLQLPQAMQARDEPCNQEEKEGKVSTNDNKESVEDDISSSKCSNCSNCTTLSLKFVVSSQNVSSTTTSSASNAHTHHA